MAVHANREDSQQTITLEDGKFEIDVCWNIAPSTMEDKRIGSATQLGKNVKKAQEMLDKAQKTESEIESMK